MIFKENENDGQIDLNKVIPLTIIDVKKFYSKNNTSETEKNDYKIKFLIAFKDLN